MPSHPTCLTTAIWAKFCRVGRQGPLLFLVLLALGGCEMKSRVDQCNELAAVLNEAPTLEVKSDTPPQKAADELGRTSKAYGALAKQAQLLELEDEEVGALRDDLQDVFEDMSVALERGQAALLQNNMPRYIQVEKRTSQLTDRAVKLGRKWQTLCTKQ